jgi:hypothetical protein
MNYRIAALAMLTVGLPAATGVPTEHAVKAAYLYNFAKFTEWPELDPAGHLAICVYGKDPFGGFLDEAVRGKLVHGLPIVIRRMPLANENWDGCQVLFFGSGSQTDSALRQLSGASILTVGASQGFAERGGMIGLVVENASVRFDINLTAIAAARLKISSQLIEIGRVVGPKK